MGRVLFSSLGGKIIDNRGLDPGQYTIPERMDLPLEFEGRRLRAFMAIQGLVIADATVNVVEMTHAYVKEVFKISCGDCSIGYLGTKVILDTLGKFIIGEAIEDNLDLLERVGSRMMGTTRCDFCALAEKPVLDTLKYFRGEYLRLIGGKSKIDRSNYLIRVTSPCMEACPAHQDIPGYIELTENRRYEEALRLIRDTNCFPGAIGRACVAFCEANCVRNDIDEPLAIRALKRFPADYEMTAGEKPIYRDKKGKTQKVAVVGAGPAGLAASYNLRLMGYQVTIFDEQAEAGGIALAGIPSYRLPKGVLEREVDIIRRPGIDVNLNIKVGEKITLGQLFEQGFEAVFIASGAHKSRPSDIENWSKDIEGLADGIEFLREINAGKTSISGERVIIVGGGNVAVDCARTCLRLGFKDVRIVYRRSREEMPASREEAEAAEEEGCQIEFLAVPLRLLIEKNRTRGLICNRVKLGETDASGRRRPVPIEGSEFVIPADIVISAIGEVPDLSFAKSVKQTQQHTIAVDPTTTRTSMEKIFSGGDCVTGPATLIEAIAAGNRAARNIDRYLRTGHVNVSRKDMFENWSHDIGLDRRRDGGIVPKSSRQSPERVPPSDRVRNFEEVERSFTSEVAIKEASRCLRCYRVMLIAIANKTDKAKKKR